MIQTMLSDAHQVSLGKADFTPLLGTWENLYEKTNYLMRMTLSRGEAGFQLHAVGSGSPEPVDWGEVPASVFVADGTNRPLGFHAHFEIGDVVVDLAANINQGICVLQSYTTFRDGSGRIHHFSKEYFRRRETQLSS